MSVLVLKIVLLVAMAVAALLFGLLPMKIYDYIEKKRAVRATAEKRATRILSMLSCFSGGVFLGVCLLDLFPIANEAFNEIKQQYKWNTDYPYTELLIGSGFFLVYLVEVLSNQLCGHSHSSYDAKQTECKHCENEDDMIEQWSNGQSKENGQPIKTEQIDKAVLAPASKDLEKESFIRSLTLVIAFSLHSCLEGFAFGVQYTMFTVTTLFLGIIVHKSVVAFSIGMNLIRTHPGKIYLVIFLVTFVALTAPIGGLIGIALESASIDEQSRNIVTATITSIANGTFIYVTFFEVLYVEQRNGEPKLVQWLSTAAGFVLIAILMVFDA